jgi:hypothetical protein
MKRKMSPELLAKEAAYWEKMKKAMKEIPGKGCHK